jgi:hypothetical protein
VGPRPGIDTVEKEVKVLEIRNLSPRRKTVSDNLLSWYFDFGSILSFLGGRGWADVNR